MSIKTDYLFWSYPVKLNGGKQGLIQSDTRAYLQPFNRCYLEAHFDLEPEPLPWSIATSAPDRLNFAYLASGIKALEGFDLMLDAEDC